MNNFIFPTGKYIAGVDEVGRGSLVGPVVAAAVILNPNKQILGLTDSKKLSEKKRLYFYNEIQKKALSWSLGRAESKEIDHMNILQATMLAMHRAISGLHIIPDLVLIDGNRCPVLPMDCQAIVKGDSLVCEISAASIIAKVTRDREMKNLDYLYPDYGFAQNKGYPTLNHRNKLLLLGITSQHRRSFSPVRNVLTNMNTKLIYSS